MYEVISLILTLAMLCVASIVVGYGIGLIAVAVDELLDTRREARELDPDEPIPFTLTDESGTDRQAVQR
ncbi:hypothetical protein BO226_04815 [Rhodococcus sp. 2G]|uniref:hypothetical protein n=1 Tax=Rhodococcus sp. 2G TaxID=1570939 RepID=UPI00090421EE|nr:hypothetical protein [Rhodococcus sp. 2G]APE08624.1 hypothetical protein BO226_04815 [Rhodococcus sp. 2G]